MADASQLPRRIIKVRVDGARARATRRTRVRERGGRRGDARDARARERPRGTLTDDDDARARFERSHRRRNDYSRNRFPESPCA
jgi:hypothetical protein